MNGSPVAAVIRGWVRLYTRGLPSELRDARRDEVDDDMWCEHAEAAAAGRSARSLGVDMFLRLLFGMPSDISWRLTNRNGAPAASMERRSSTSTRILGLLVIGSVSAHGFLAILSSLMGEEALWTLSGALVLGLGAMIALIAAALGLAWHFQDRIGPLGGFGAVVMTLGELTTIGAGFFAPVPVGSAMLMWDLAPIVFVSRLVLIVQAVTAILAVATVIGLIVGMSGVITGALIILYLGSWLAMGVSLIGGVPLPRATTA